MHEESPTVVGQLAASSSLMAACQRAAPVDLNPLVCDPMSTFMRQEAPNVYRIRVQTSEGNFHITVNRTWAPYQADRFYNLARGGYYNLNYFYRVLHDWVAQWGVHPEPAVTAVYQSENNVPGSALPDDPNIAPNDRGTVAFGAEYDTSVDPPRIKPRTRSNEIYINYRDNGPALDSRGFAPFGYITPEEMSVVDTFYDGYGEVLDVLPDPSSADDTKNISEARAVKEGNSYLEQYFPMLDQLRSVELIEDAHPDGDTHRASGGNGDGSPPTRAPFPIVPIIMITIIGVVIMCAIASGVKRVMRARAERRQQDWELLELGGEALQPARPGRSRTRGAGSGGSGGNGGGGRRGGRAVGASERPGTGPGGSHLIPGDDMDHELGDNNL